MDKNVLSTIGLRYLWNNEYLSISDFESIPSYDTPLYSISRAYSFYFNNAFGIIFLEGGKGKKERAKKKFAESNGIPWIKTCYRRLPSDIFGIICFHYFPRVVYRVLRIISGKSHARIC